MFEKEKLKDMLDNKKRELIDLRHKLREVRSRNLDLKSVIMQLLEIEPTERIIRSTDGEYERNFKTYPGFDVETNDKQQLVMTIDQYNSLKPSVQKRLRKLDLVTVPIDKNTDYLKLLEDIRK